eukprot:jgi/Chlat1/1695/Chrsp127S00094
MAAVAARLPAAWTSLSSSSSSSSPSYLAASTLRPTQRHQQWRKQQPSRLPPPPPALALQLLPPRSSCRRRRRTPSARCSDFSSPSSSSSSVESSSSSSLSLAEEVAELLEGVSVYIVGMMGSGKTTVAAALASALGYACLDCDSLLVAAAGNRPIRVIFAEEGEDAFRDAESAVLSQASAYKRVVLSTGGGVVLRGSNWGHLHAGLVVWLDVPVEHLAARVIHDGASSRPLVASASSQSSSSSSDDDEADAYSAAYERLSGILRERRALYEQADVVVKIDGGSGQEAVANAVLREIKRVLVEQRTARTKEEWERRKEAEAEAEAR